MKDAAAKSKVVTLGTNLLPSNQPIFTKEGVQVQPLITEADVRIQRLTIVRFTNGSRTRLHTHTYDQVLLATEGEGIVAIEGQEYELKSGQVVAIPAGTPHWHGARDNVPFAHINIATPGETTILQ